MGAETLAQDPRPSVLLFVFRGQRLSAQNDLVFRGFRAWLFLYPVSRYVSLSDRARSPFSFQGPETSQLGERPRDPQTASVRQLRLGWAAPGRRRGRPAGSSSVPAAVHVPTAAIRRETLLVLR